MADETNFRNKSRQTFYSSMNTEAGGVVDHH